MEIRLHGITKRFEKKQVIRPTSLTIDSGSFTTLLGPSGCGKTTLLRMIVGLETPDDGEIYFDGTCVFSREKRINLPPERRGLGFVFQDFALWPHMTVFEEYARRFAWCIWRILKCASKRNVSVISKLVPQIYNWQQNIKISGTLALRKSAAHFLNFLYQLF